MSWCGAYFCGLIVNQILKHFISQGWAILRKSNCDDNVELIIASFIQYLNVM